MLTKRAVPTSTIHVEPYEISPQKYEYKIANREQEASYDHDRVQRAITKHDIVLNRKQSGVKAIVDGNLAKVQHIEHELNHKREEREKSFWKMNAFSTLQTHLRHMRHEWDDYLRMEEMKQYQGYQDHPDYLELDMPEGVPDVSAEEIQTYFPHGNHDNEEALHWQVRMLQAAKMTEVDASLFDPFANQAIVNYHRQLDPNDTNSSASSEEYQKALWELSAVIDLDEEAARKASELHGDTCGELATEIHKLEAAYKYYSQKYDAWTAFSAKRARRS